MSNPGPQINRNNTQPGLDKLEAPTSPAHSPQNTDLSQLSTKQSEMKIERPTSLEQEVARVRPLSLSQSNSPTHTISTKTEQRTTRADRKEQSSGPHGLLKNPYYRYSGGPFMRILIFVANLLKSLEQLVLRTLDKFLGKKTQRVNVPKADPQAAIPEEETEPAHTLCSARDARAAAPPR